MEQRRLLLQQQRPDPQQLPDSVVFQQEPPHRPPLLQTLLKTLDCTCQMDYHPVSQFNNKTVVEDRPSTAVDCQLSPSQTVNSSSSSPIAIIIITIITTTASSQVPAEHQEHCHWRGTLLEATPPAAHCTPATTTSTPSYRPVSSIPSSSLIFSFG